MNKHFIFFLVFIAVNILHAEPGDNKNQLDNNDLRHSMLYFQYKSGSIITDYYSQVNNFSLFNDNVNFSNQAHTFNSALKIGGEIISGSVFGFVLGSFMYRAFEPKIKEENFIGEPIRLIFTGIGVLAGTTGGVYYFGKIFGDEGELKNMIGWMAIISLVTNAIVRSITSNENSRIWIPIASLPIGAAFGFNTNDISDWIFPSNR